MENLLLRHCRQQAGYKPERAAVELGIEPDAYMDIENGERPLSAAEADQLGRLFNMDPKVLQATALQLEMLRTAHEFIKGQERLIEALTATVINPAL